MIFVILILLAVLVMLLTTRPRKKLIWLRYTLIAIILIWLIVLVADYILLLNSEEAIR